MELMVECNFDAVFWALKPQMKKALLTKNKTHFLSESAKRPMAGFIIGFDGKNLVRERIVQFAEQTAIPTTMFGMLQVLPNTALWHRKRSKAWVDGNINQTTLMNFIPPDP